MNYPETETVPILVRSQIEGKSEYASTAVSVTARCVTSGFNHIGLSLRRRPVRLDVDPKDLKLQSEGVYKLEGPGLYKYASRIFGESVSIESFASDGIELKFEDVDYKKLPIIPMSSISFKPQYTAVGGIALSPDSVVVYGDSTRLKTVEAIYTKPLRLSDIGSNGAHGRVRLEGPSGVNLSSRETSYRLDTKRFVEIKSKYIIKVINAPMGENLNLFPPQLNATVRCEFPVIDNPLPKMEFYVDYKDFENSKTGKCLIRHGSLPSGVIHVDIYPEVCECIIR